MSTIKKEVAKNLQYFRKKQHMTQRELASQLGVKHNAISSWEKGINSIDIDVLFKICQILNLSINDMFGNSNSINKNVYSKKEVLLIQHYREKKDLQKAVDILLEIKE